MQHSELQTLTNDDGATLRDQFMAENVQWILQQEQRNGHENIFVTGHNSHVAKWGSSDSMGKLLSKDAANGYYVIGTDFGLIDLATKTVVNEKNHSAAIFSLHSTAASLWRRSSSVCVGKRHRF